MGKSFYLPVICVFLFFSATGCKKILDDITEQTVTTDFTEIDFTADTGTAGTYTETLDVISPNLDSLLQYEGYDQGKVKSIKITDALIELKSDGNLDPFGSFLITLGATGKPAVTVAEVTIVPTGITEIALVRKGVDLSGYLKSDHYTIKVKSVLDQNLEAKKDLQAKVRYEIKVGI
jgi:hypothetical protein